MELYADRGVRIQIGLIEELVQELSVSTRLVGVSEELRRSLAKDRRALPEVYDRFVRLNAEEPYRLKCSYVHARLENTRTRYAAGSPHVPGRDYLGSAEYLRDLEVMDRRCARTWATGSPTGCSRRHAQRQRRRAAPGLARRPRAHELPPRRARGAVRPARRAGDPLRRARPRGPHRAAVERAGRAARADPAAELAADRRRQLPGDPRGLRHASATCRRPTARRPCTPTSCRWRRTSTTCSPSPCSPARPAWSRSPPARATSRRPPRRSTSCRCSRRRPS